MEFEILAIILFLMFFLFILVYIIKSKCLDVRVLYSEKNTDTLIYLLNKYPIVFRSLLLDKTKSLNKQIDILALVIIALCKLNCEQEIITIIEKMRKYKLLININTLLALEAFQNKKIIIEFLIELLDDTDKDVRALAVYSLGNTGDGEILGLLSKKKNDVDDRVQTYAKTAIKKIMEKNDARAQES